MKTYVPIGSIKRHEIFFYIKEKITTSTLCSSKNESQTVFATFFVAIYKTSIVSFLHKQLHMHIVSAILKTQYRVEYRVHGATTCFPDIVVCTYITNTKSMDNWIF